MASFHEVRLPTSYDGRSSFGPGFNTGSFRRDSGFEERFARWTAGRRRFSVAYSIRSLEDLAELLSFFHARAGTAYGFRFKDKADFTSAANHQGTPSPTDVEILGSGVTYQLRKLYGSDVRTITKPVSGTVRIAVGGVEATSGWSVSTTTGVVTFVSPPGGTVTAGFEFDVPVRFVTEQLTISHDDYETGTAQTLELIETKE